MDIETQRVCKKCAIRMPLIANFHKVKKVGDNVYYSHICRICTIQSRREYMKRYHKEHYIPTNTTKYIEPSDILQIENI